MIILPSRPFEGQNYWYEDRETYDDALEQVVTELDDSVKNLTDDVSILSESSESFSLLINTLISEGRLSEAALNSNYVNYVIGTETGYPEFNRIPGAFYMFFGETNPGELMLPGEYWLTPDSLTIADIITAMANPNHDLYKTVKTVSSPDRIEFGAMDFASVGNGPVTLKTINPGTLAPNSLPMLSFADGVVSVGGRIWRSPKGWNACRIYIDWSHRVQPASLNGTPVTWQCRLTPYLGDGHDLIGTQSAPTITIASTFPDIRKVKRQMFASNFTLNPEGAEVILSILRMNAPATTDGSGEVLLAKVIIERTA